MGSLLVKILELDENTVRSLKEFVDVWEGTDNTSVTWVCIECGKVHKLNKFTCDCGFELPVRIDDSYK